MQENWEAKLDLLIMWYKRESRSLLFLLSGLVVCVLRSGIALLVAFSHTEISHAKNGFEKVFSVPGKWVFTCLLYYWPQAITLHNWYETLKICIALFVSLFIPYPRVCYLPLRDFLSPFPIFVGIDNNIFCDIRGLKVKYQNQGTWQCSMYIPKYNFNL